MMRFEAAFVVGKSREYIGTMGKCVCVRVEGGKIDQGAVSQAVLCCSGCCLIGAYTRAGCGRNDR